MQLPKIVGHRGAPFYAPENTLASLYKAAELGLSWIEFDVMLSADDHPIIMHDETLNRTTNGIGKVAQTSFETIKSLDAGSWFSKEFTGEKVPTFLEFLMAAKQHNLGINVEIKPTLGKDTETAKAVVELLLLHTWPACQEVLVSSFSWESLKMVREISRELPLGLLLDQWTKGWQQTLISLDCVSLNVDYRMLTLERVKTAKQLVKHVLAYTVDDVKTAEQLYEWGVDGVFSNRLLPNVVTTSQAGKCPNISL